MKKVLLFTFAIITLFTTSCKEEHSAFKNHEGTWTGTYFGEDYGTWNVTINNEGVVNGVARSDSFPKFPFSIVGTVNTNGDFEASGDVFMGKVDFTGVLNENHAYGDWVNDSSWVRGMWAGTKR